MTRQISSGKSAQFPVVGTTSRVIILQEMKSLEARLSTQRKQSQLMTC